MDGTVSEFPDVNIENFVDRVGAKVCVPVFENQEKLSLRPLCLRAEAILREGGTSGEAGERQDSDFVDKNIYFYKIANSLMH